MKKLFTLAACLLLVTACIEEPVAVLEESKALPSSFDFNTTAEVNISLNFSLANGDAIAGVPIELWDKPKTAGGKMLFRALTDKTGRISNQLALPAYLDKVVLEANYIGIPNSLWLPINGRQITMSYEGGVKAHQLAHTSSANLSGPRSSAAPNNMQDFSTENGLAFNYVGGFNGQGVPDYLEPERDVISAQLLEYINASLPESQPVPEYHPTFLASGKKTTLDIVQTCDVWVTFVHEGAGFRNAIGFYTYDSGTPPQSINDISDVNVIFPNLSFAGSGGGLYSGDKVNIGRFEAGTSIGLVLMADGWDGSNSEDYYHIVYGDNRLNPETDEALKQHNVILWDEENELFLIGFEDILRDNRPFWCDNDFNDAILFVTSNPVEAISTENVNPIDKPDALDSDGDGINDIFDEYPDDGSKAYDSYYP